MYFECVGKISYDFEQIFYTSFTTFVVFEYHNQMENFLFYWRITEAESIYPQLRVIKTRL